MNETALAPKSAFASKTVLVNAVIALAALYPPVGVWLKTHPDLALQALAIINLGLRFVTKGKITLFPSV